MVACLCTETSEQETDILIYRVLYIHKREMVLVLPGVNISQNFSEIISGFLIIQFSEKFWEIFQNSSESSRLSPKITD